MRARERVDGRGESSASTGPAWPQLAQEVLDEQRHVVGALAQRRHAHATTASR